MRFRHFICLLIISIPAFSHAGLFGLLADEVPYHNTLIEAADVGNSGYVKNLISKGYPVNSIDSNGQTALMKAALRGNQNMVKILVNAGADVNMQDKSGNTALHYAASHDHISVSDELLKHGARTDIVNRNGQTALQAALDSKSINVAKLIDPTSVVAVESEAFLPVAAVAGISGKTIAVGLGAAAAGGAAAAAGGGGGSGGSEGGGSSGGGGNNGGGDNGGGGNGGDNGGNEGGGDSGGDNNGGDQGDSGGDSGGEDNSTTTIIIPDNTIDNGTPTSFRTTEFLRQSGLNKMNAQYAYARGYTGVRTDSGHEGESSVVAVVDSGVDINHPDLSVNIASSGRDFVSNDNIADSDCGSDLTSGGGCWHGTHVAGIIAAAKNNIGMHGVAYNAKILPVRVLNTNGSGTEENVASGIDYAVEQGAQIINLSLGGGDISGIDPFPEITHSIRNAVNSGVIVVAATGNDMQTQPDWPAKNAGDITVNSSSVTGALIAVASINSNNTISVWNSASHSGSNYCGDAKEWCLVASGTSITSTVPTSLTGFGGYGVASGTSMATPQVSGAAAILLAAFPNLSPRDAALILLNTATDLGEAGVDSIYGHGLLNLEAATRPNGEVIIPLSNNVEGSNVGLSSSSIILSGAFGNSLKNSDASFSILDSYNRYYAVNLSAVTGSNISHVQASDSFENFAQPAISKVSMVNIDENLAFGFGSEDSKELPDQGGQVQAQTSYFSMVSEQDGLKQSVNYNIPVAQYFGFGAVGDLDGSIFLGEATQGNPYLALASDGVSSISSFTFGNGDIHTNFTIFEGKNKDSGYAASGFASEVAAQFNGFVMASQFGVVNEKESFLGSHSSGAFAVGDGSTPTWFYNFSGSIDIANDMRLFGVFSEGITSPATIAGSLITEISDIRSQSFAGGVMLNDNFLENDMLAFAVSKPLHVTSGNAVVDIPYVADINGNVYRRNISLNLAPSNVETDVELFYKVPLDTGTVSIGAMRRNNPDNLQNAESEDLLVFKFINKF